ncbi:MAG: isochorismate synthase [Polyangiaceae bacterium]
MLGEASPPLTRSASDDVRRAGEAVDRAGEAADRAGEVVDRAGEHVLAALRALLERAASGATPGATAGPGDAHPPCATPSSAVGGACAMTVGLGGALASILLVDAHRALCAVFAEDAFLWGEPGGGAGGEGGDAGPAWSFAGAGAALRLEASGPERVDTILARARPILAGLQDVRGDGAAVAAPRPALFGGVAFTHSSPDGGHGGGSAVADDHATAVPGAPRAASPAAASRLQSPQSPVAAEVWRGFADASFVLPRWLIGRRGGAAFLRFALARAPHGDELQGLCEEARAVVTALAAIVAERGCTASDVRPASAVRVATEPMASWTRNVDDAVARIARGELAKVVASTRTLLDAERPFDVHAALGRLDEGHPQCVRFAFARGEGRGAATFLGATPERLVDKRGAVARLDALAGTLRRGLGDTAAPRALIESDKDRREHAVVVDFLRDTLAPFGAVRASREPGVRTLRDLHHLWTPVEVTLAAATHVLELVACLHPTPAVCGTPRVAARSWVQAHEPTPRGWYAGAIGWFDAAGDGSFAVALRSALVRGNQAWLFAGAGIVAGSVAARERAEVELKQRPMLNALGVQR